ncbi:DUF2815 family protein [Paenibacillus thiaminolyticus]|nr:DUF2815 family protein [Paenibacillus thiaminolyticus]MDG0876490.1 DUF2815 family protein [Paenibacillus thiaminolyticus]
MTNQIESTNVTTGEVRLSYVNLFQPRANQPGQEPKYSTTILIPKADVASKQRIDSAIAAAINRGCRQFGLVLALPNRRFRFMTVTAFVRTEKPLARSVRGTGF